MLKTLTAILEMFAKAIMISRHIKANPSQLDEIRRMSIILALDDTRLARRQTAKTGADFGGTISPNAAC